MNTLDESVWATLSRDLSAVWEKMRLVLWPNRLLGGALTNRGGGLGAAERGEASEDLMGGIRGLAAGRWPVDAETVLQGGMSEGLRDWDLWWARPERIGERIIADTLQGTSALLSTLELVSIYARGLGSEVTGVLWRVCDYMVGRGGGDCADQASGWQHVRRSAPS